MSSKKSPVYRETHETFGICAYGKWYCVEYDRPNGRMTAVRFGDTYKEAHNKMKKRDNVSNLATVIQSGSFSTAANDIPSGDRCEFSIAYSEILVVTDENPPKSYRYWHIEPQKVFVDFEKTHTIDGMSVEMVIATAFKKIMESHKKEVVNLVQYDGVYYTV